MTPAPDPSWERRHPSRLESWSFDFFAPDARVAGFVGLTLFPAPRPRAWYWAALVGEGRPYLLVRDLEIEAPRRPGSREVRADGLWADINCETPLEHWSMGLEAFGVSMDDPDEALGDERGDRIGLGLDLEWEAVAGGVVGDEGDYGQACDVSGQILVGVGSVVEEITFDGYGWRWHRCGGGTAAVVLGGGGPAGVVPAGERLSGRLDDGTPFMAGAAGGAAEVPAEGAREVLFRAPLRLDGGRVLERSFCRFSVAGAGTGMGWHERVS
ncbi:MAG TPA: hypothetical protein VNA57_03005 [Acidimicrobiales bacterium]|nr:hypothetical protein [Acidimicrobiales bacterium]